MDTEFVYVEGKTKFLHLVNVNKFGDWAITIYPDTESLEKIRDLQARGIKNVMKKDEDGYYIQFKRAANQDFSGKIIRNLPPVVWDKDKQPMDGSKVGFGSDVIIKLEIASGINKKLNARWMRAKLEEVLVKMLVPYTPGSPTENSQVITAGIVDRNPKSPLF